jgi:hypothetical protein
MSVDSVHRDNSSGLESGDLVFGGFVNLNQNEDQKVTLQAGTHEFRSLTGGQSFTKVGDAEAQRFSAGKEDFIVPPKHGIMFFENILHEVVSGTVPHDTYRKFIAFRLTRSQITWHPPNVGARERQSPMAHKGGKIARLEPGNYNMHPDLAARYQQRFSQAMQPIYEDNRFLSLKKPLYSLRDLGMPYADYEPIHSNLYRPHPYLLNRPPRLQTFLDSEYHPLSRTSRARLQGKDNGKGKDNWQGRSKWTDLGVRNTEWALNRLGQIAEQDNYSPPPRRPPLPPPFDPAAPRPPLPPPAPARQPSDSDFESDAETPSPDASQKISHPRTYFVGSSDEDEVRRYF